MARRYVLGLVLAAALIAATFGYFARPLSENGFHRDEGPCEEAIRHLYIVRAQRAGADQRAEADRLMVEACNN